MTRARPDDLPEDGRPERHLTSMGSARAASGLLAGDQTRELSLTQKALITPFIKSSKSLSLSATFLLRACGRFKLLLV